MAHMGQLRGLLEGGLGLSQVRFTAPEIGNISKNALGGHDAARRYLRCDVALGLQELRPNAPSYKSASTV